MNRLFSKISSNYNSIASLITLKPALSHQTIVVDNRRHGSASNSNRPWTTKVDSRNGTRSCLDLQPFLVPSGTLARDIHVNYELKSSRDDDDDPYNIALVIAESREQVLQPTSGLLMKKSTLSDTDPACWMPTWKPHAHRPKAEVDMSKEEAKAEKKRKQNLMYRSLNMVNKKKEVIHEDPCEDRKAQQRLKLRKRVAEKAKKKKKVPEDSGGSCQKEKKRKSCDQKSNDYFILPSSGHLPPMTEDNVVDSNNSEYLNVDDIVKVNRNQMQLMPCGTPCKEEKKKKGDGDCHRPKGKPHAHRVQYDKKVKIDKTTGKVKELEWYIVPCKKGECDRHKSITGMISKKRKQSPTRKQPTKKAPPPAPKQDDRKRRQCEGSIRDRKFVVLPPRLELPAIAEDFLDESPNYDQVQYEQKIQVADDKPTRSTKNLLTDPKFKPQISIESSGEEEPGEAYYITMDEKPTISTRYMFRNPQDPKMYTSDVQPPISAKFKPENETIDEYPEDIDFCPQIGAPNKPTVQLGDLFVRMVH